MNPRTTLIMAALAGALGAFIWLYEIGGEPARLAAEEAGKRILPGFDGDEVEWISLVTSDGRSARAERVGGGWRLVEPLDFPADSVALDGMASALVELVPEQKLEEPQLPGVYGIEEGGRSVRLFAAGEERALLIGRGTPVGTNTYVARASDDEIYTVPTWRVNALAKSLDELRDRRVLPFEQDAVVRIEAIWPEGRVVAVRAETSATEEASAAAEWRLAEPLETVAHPATIEALLSDLAYLRAEGFVDDALTDDAGGFAPADLQIVLTSRPDGGEETTRHFALGAERDGRRLARGTEAALYVLPSERIDDFPRDLAQYRDRRMARFAASEAARIELGFATPQGARSVALSRDEGQWRLEAADAAETANLRLAAERVPALLERLSTLDARGIDADRLGGAELAAFALAPPNARLRVTDEDGVVLAEVLLGGLDVERGIAAMTPGSDIVYRLDAAVAEDLPIEFAAFEARFVEQVPELLPDVDVDAGAGGERAPMSPPEPASS